MSISGTGFNHWFANEHYTQSWAPSRLSNLVAWFDASDADTLTLDGNNVTQWDDKSGNDKHATEGTASHQPTYNSVNKAVVWPDAASGVGLVLTNSCDLKEIIFVCKYQDGTASSFSDYDNLLTKQDVMFGEPRIMGDVGTSNLITTVAFADKVYKNNSDTPSNTILPLPLTVCRFKSSTMQSGLWHIGRRWDLTTSRAWQGDICEVIGVSSDLSADDLANLWQYLSNKWGIS